ncbi:hypothetical protein CVT26_001461 [Gymnopilus dilepis]|uniref:Uncharacterized protein n=1 Tax=Gymnopilus dilepis TaxID=231916 RepID=A0A409WBC4_9AGAR|nr:hypothetical protein CVT26_001461 [Gymnopilus dilepis]
MVRSLSGRRSRATEVSHGGENAEQQARDVLAIVNRHTGVGLAALAVKNARLLFNFKLASVIVADGINLEQHEEDSLVGPRVLGPVIFVCPLLGALAVYGTTLISSSTKHSYDSADGLVLKCTCRSLGCGAEYVAWARHPLPPRHHLLTPPFPASAAPIPTTPQRHTSRAYIVVSRDASGHEFVHLDYTGSATLTARVFGKLERERGLVYRAD